MPRKTNRPRRSRRTVPRAGTELVYTGPARPRVSPAFPHVTGLRLTVGAFPIAANSSGIVRIKITNDPTASVEWTTVSNLWTQCRIVSSKWTYVPRSHNYDVTGTTPGSSILSGNSALGSPLYWATTRNAAVSAPGLTYDGLTQYEDCLMTSSDTKAVRTLKGNGIPDMSWVPVASVAAGSYQTGALVCFSSGMTPNITYGIVTLELWMEFRERS